MNSKGEMRHDGPSPPIRPVAESGISVEEPLVPPGKTDLASLTDGRSVGQWQTVYPWHVWLQIIFELAWLASAFVLALYFLARLSLAVTFGIESEIVTWACGNSASENPLYVWAATAAGGVVGGTCFAFKWLYHVVAKQRWHRDRLIWRIIVPPLSGVLALFTALMIKSGIVPFLSAMPFDTPTLGAAYGFFVGLFSDNLMAALQNTAQRVLGTVKDRTTGGAGSSSVDNT